MAKDKGKNNVNPDEAFTTEEDKSLFPIIVAFIGGFLVARIFWPLFAALIHLAFIVAFIGLCCYAAGWYFTHRDK